MNDSATFPNSRLRVPAGRLLLAACLVAGIALTQPARAQAREEAQVIVATQVLEELRGARDQYIPDRLLERAFGIAVIPDVTKAAFIFGARHGKGVLVVRDGNGRFSNPSFVTLGGGSVGWQAGAQETDVVLVFTTRAGVEGITDGKLALGADASVAAGPVGRTASAATDPTFSAEIYSYSRSRGLFAGVALDGTVLAIDRGANARYYGGKRVNTTDIFNGTVKKDSESVRRLLAAITASTTNSTTGSRAEPTATPREATAPASVETGTGAGDAKTYPLEDAKPGQEPPQ